MGVLGLGGFGLERIKQGRRWLCWVLVWFGLLERGGWAGLGLGVAGAMCRGSCVKDHPVRDVQLESLILAQNERWRQA